MDRNQSPQKSHAELDRLRQRYFAQSIQSVRRYGVSFDRLQHHLDGIPLNRIVNRRSRNLYLNDVIHAIACLDDVEAAWTDLHDAYEQRLVRICRSRFNQAASIVFVRQLLARLRDPTSTDVLQHHVSLHSYSGDQPLQSWLADRVIGSVSRIDASTASEKKTACLVEPKIDPVKVDRESLGISASLHLAGRQSQFRSRTISVSTPASARTASATGNGWLITAAAGYGAQPSLTTASGGSYCLT